MSNSVLYAFLLFSVGGVILHWIYIYRLMKNIFSIQSQLEELCKEISNYHTNNIG